MEPAQLALVLSVSLPLLGALLVAILHRASYWVKAHLATLFAALAFAASAFSTYSILTQGPVVVEALLLRAPGLDVRHLLYGDALSSLFALTAGFFGFIAMLYSIDDVAHEEGQARYYALMLLFQGGMIGLFSAGNLLLLFAFWELVGLCSYGLIGFYMRKPESRVASMKALVMTHTCGAAVLIGLLALLAGGMGLEIASLKAAAPGALGLLSMSSLLFLLGSMSKSVQLPLHTWLPDITIAPSAVTALHSAAMVKAGVYLMARAFSLLPSFAVSPHEAVNLALATVGAITLTVCSASAWLQDDVKRLLAYHCSAQIGYMFLGLGLGTAVGVAGGLFHFFNHAILKGLLFLGAGCLIYATKTRSLREMGGLARNMPVTAAAMIIGGLSLAGVPPLNGFASKLLIYEGALDAALRLGEPLGGVYAVYCALALLGSAFTLASVLKLIHSAFFGLRPKGLEGVREVPAAMRAPLIILSSLCILFGVAPSLALDYLINPATSLIAGGGLQTYVALGYVTTLGFYEASGLATIMALALLLGWALYKASSRPLARAPEALHLPFTGGEAAEPYLSLDETKVGPAPFYFSLSTSFRPLYKFMAKGGLDLGYFGLARFIERRAGSLAALLLIAATGFLIARAEPSWSFGLYVGYVLTIAAAFAAAAHRDLKRLLVAAVAVQLGDAVMMLGVAQLPVGLELAKHAVAGSLAHLVNMAIASLSMALSVAAVSSIAKTTRLDGLRGLASIAPATALAFLASGLAVACVPPFNTWWSAYQLYSSLAEVGRWELVLAVALAKALLAASVVKGFNSAFMGEAAGVRAGEAAGLAAPALALAGLCVFLGAYPDPLFNWAWGVAEGLLEVG
ncbi:MAG: proton-conducting transporter membrane subunit [Candidatus Nezhaarchaeota archaeon]|nr:proton-conducting transporter membrane subunit [Candidatus Nezhaarchaeota archaeon]